MSEVLPVLVDCDPYATKLSHQACVARWKLASSKDAAPRHRQTKCRGCEVGQVRYIEAKQLDREADEKGTATPQVLARRQAARDYGKRLREEMALQNSMPPATSTRPVDEPPPASDSEPIPEETTEMKTCPHCKRKLKRLEHTDKGDMCRACKTELGAVRAKPGAKSKAARAARMIFDFEQSNPEIVEQATAMLKRIMGERKAAA